MSIKLTILALAFLVGCLTLTNVELGDNDDPTSYITTLNDVTFEGKDIAIVPRSQKYFFFLSKDLGKLQMVVEMSKDEQFIRGECPYLIFKNSKGKIKQFNCQKKKLIIKKIPGISENTDILGQVYSENKEFILTTEDLRMYDNDNSIILFTKPKETGKGKQTFQKAITLFQKNTKEYRIGLFSSFQNKEGKTVEVCIRLFANGKMVEKNPVCIAVKGQVSDIRFKGQQILLIMDDKTYVLTNDFQILTVLQGKALFANRNFISFDKKSYDLSKQAIYNDLVSFQRRKGQIARLKNKKNKYVVEEITQKDPVKHGQIQMKDGIKADRFWFDISENGQKIQLLVQWENNDISYHVGQAGELKNIWQVKSNRQ